jgi:peroxiredoxin
LIGNKLIVGVSIIEDAMKKSRLLSCLLASLCLSGAASFLHAEDVATSDLKLMTEGATMKIGSYSPLKLELSTDKPAALKKAPEMTAPLYGELKFAGKSYLIALDEPDGKDAMIYVDANSNGDLSDDAPAVWNKKVSGPAGQQRTMYMGSFKLPLSDGPSAGQVQLNAYRFDKNDPQRAALKQTLLYYSDYAYDGQITLNGESHHAMLTNPASDGNFSSEGVNGRPGVRLLIDVNDNGRFDSQGEAFDVHKPFNIKGTSWKLADLTSTGTFKIAKSDVAVAEIPTPPNLVKGNAAVVFQAQDMDGKAVNFPADYKGKIVILDFWATWCGPCMGEVPGLVTAYNQFHPKGVEVLGITLDQADSADKVKKVAADNKMTWPQVYDGKYWSSRVAQMYGIDSIPHPFLVDGDTGKIIAEGDVLRGDSLAKTLQSALDEKGKLSAAN